MPLVHSTMPLDIWKCYNWFNGKPEDRLLSWRQFRNSLTDHHAEIVAFMWAKCPTVDHHLEIDDTRYWPDPWTLISDGIYCNTSIALGMYYTLYFSSYSFRDNMRIEIYKDRKKHEYLNLLLVDDGLYTLNYNLGKVVNTPIISSHTVLINTVTHKNLPIKQREIST